VTINRLPVLNYIHWNLNPEILPGILPIRWYGLLFMLGFVFGYYIIQRMYRREGKDVAALDQLSLYVGLGTILGARLGHCLFYEPDFYLSHPLQILYIWQGGLASHGAVIGILLSIYLYGRRFPQTDFWFIADRLVTPVALAGSLIRLGNLANSEIYGLPATVPWAFIFVRVGDGIPRHPTQLYEALYYLICFVLLYNIYYKTNKSSAKGYLLGLFMCLIFGYRFIVEFWKENQVEMENGLAFNLGQLLSIPVVAVGVWLMLRSRNVAADATLGKEHTATDPKESV